ncbi:MAG: DeoR/GlpR family DNA-binding transcription regulator [Angelakisella sp.]
MKNSQSIVDNRRNKILQLLEQTGSVCVNSLAEELTISPLTVRRDLDYFEKMGVVERFHGGAALKTKLQSDNIFSSVYTLHKHAIARRAAQLVSDGDTIFINTSSTALLMLGYITAKMVTVITNNGKAIFCDTRDDMILLLTGGELRAPKEAMVGEFALNNLNRVMASKCFLGCSGLTLEEGMTTAVLQEVAVNELMLTRVTGARYLLADHSKIGRKHSFMSGAVEQISCLITDTDADKSILRQLAERGVQIIQVPPLKKLD